LDVGRLKGIDREDVVRLELALFDKSSGDSESGKLILFGVGPPAQIDDVQIFAIPRCQSRGMLARA